MVDQYSPPEREAEGQMLMNRRSFLAGAGGLTLTTLLAGCQRSSGSSLRLAMLTNSVPAQLLSAFQQLPERGSNIAVNPKESLVELYGLLQQWHRQAEDTLSQADWVSLADYWLAPAIRQELVQPLEVSALTHWDDLAAVWPELVRRNAEGMLSPDGSIWAVPYRWSHLVVLYDRDRLPSPSASLTTWADLLRPELRRRVVLPNHPRLVLGLAQKALGASANTEDPATVEGLEPFLADLQNQVRLYDSDHYLEMLLIGDATAVVAWSDDVLPLLKQYRHLAVAVPPEGTLLSAQLWVRPQAIAPAASDQAISTALNWLDFCLDTDFALQLAIFGQGTSIRLWETERSQLPEPLQTPSTIALAPSVADQSEFLLPLSTAAEDRYSRLWQSLRS
ncbi:extracellular solute-binding protein [Nodosilinea sp. LEGE 07298]|uniref:extracellular solute-binding protein n=1 Tax=Nodosilinea sp. LEGE 07298 TaxID=2777970 RepID=UPI001882BB4A|nr:substrate-binding domain-containing protein [Nodosilinea sp. LEGE 07298]MBE9108424.1 extracellular solute-binding protein [Nodosilinea sp. LEGE 07298]